MRSIVSRVSSGRQPGQSTVEYGLVLVGAAALAVVGIAMRARRYSSAAGGA